MRALAAHTRRRLLDEAIADLLRARTLHDQALTLIGDSLAGHPKAARYDGHVEAVPRLWCFTHERDHRRCEHDGLTCGGTPVTVTDPTGDAATTPDVAAAALRTVDVAVAGAALMARLLAVEVTAWSPYTSATERPDPTAAVAPDGWCSNCWRDDHRHEPVGVRPGGTAPYYAGLCEWCGRFRAVHKYLPPVELVRIHHSASPRVYDRDIARYKPAGRRG